MARKLAVLSVKSFSTDTMMPRLMTTAHAAILTRRSGAIVHLDLTVSSHMTGFAVTVVVVDELYTVQGSRV